MPDAPTKIVFDLGGVVVRICRTWAEACTRASVPLRDNNNFEDVELIQKRNTLSDLYMSGKIPCDEFFAAVAQATNNLYSPQEVQAIHDVWVIDDEPGIEDLINHLNAYAHLTTACLSNTNHAHWQGLIGGPTPSPATAALQTKLVSHELGHVKPDEAIYVEAEQRLGASPDQILFFDDLEANITAAKARGWHACFIDHASPTVPQIQTHLAELRVFPST